MLFRQGFLFKLKPNGRQARLMSRIAGCCRFVYNKGLSWAKEQYENKTGKHPSYKNLFPPIRIFLLYCLIGKKILRCCGSQNAIPSVCSNR